MSHPLIEIRFAKVDCLDIVLRHAPLTELLASLGKRLGTIDSPYQGEMAILNLSAWSKEEALDQNDFAALIECARAAQLRVIGIRSPSEQHHVWSQALGLQCIEDAMMDTAYAHAHSAADFANEASGLDEPATVSQPPAFDDSNISTFHSPDTSILPIPALLIDTPVRSGQKIYGRGRDVVILGQVSPGAEVIADGHIHVYGPLRGRALAGANGNRQSRIVATSFSPELVAVAGFYMTFEGGYPANTASHPTQVYLDADDASANLRIEPINIR